MKRELSRPPLADLGSIKEIKEALEDRASGARELQPHDLWLDGEPAITSGLFLAAIEKEQNGKGRATWRNSDFWQKVDVQSVYTVKVKHKKHFPQYEALVLEGFNLIATSAAVGKPVSTGIIREIFYLDRSIKERGSLVPMYIIQRYSERRLKQDRTIRPPTKPVSLNTVAMTRELIAYQKFSFNIGWTHDEPPPPHWLEYYGSTVEVCLWQQPAIIANIIRQLSSNALEHIARDMAPFGLSSFLLPDALNAPIPAHLPARMLMSGDDRRRIVQAQELLKYPWLRLVVPKGIVTGLAYAGIWGGGTVSMLPDGSVSWKWRGYHFQGFISFPQKTCEGFGVFSYSEKGKLVWLYEGNFVSSMKHGVGKQTWFEQDGITPLSLYEGQWFYGEGANPLVLADV